MRSLVRLSSIRTFSAASAATATDTAAAGCRQQNKALSDLIRRGRLREARQVFDSLPYRNVFIWNSMISGYARHGEVARARKLFDEMPRRDLISWNCMISGYVNSYDRSELMEARRLFDQMPVRDVVSWNTIISGYTRHGKMVEAMQLFGGMHERNVISWNTVITGFLRAGDIKSAVELFEIMPVQDAASLNALVSGLIQNNFLEEATKILLRSTKVSEIEGAVDAFNTLIVGYGRVGRLKEAQSVFNLIPCEQNQNSPSRRTKIFQRNVVSWNSMIMCYVKAGDLLSARKLFDEMPVRDLVSWNTMITGYSQALEMEEAEFLFRQVDEPDVRSWNTMIFGFTQKGELEKARNFFDDLPHKEIVTWNTMIAGYEQNGDFEGAIGLFSEMLPAGERFDKHTMSSLLSACAALASLRQGTQIHQLIIKALVPDTPINNSLITMYSRCGCVIEAMCVFENMEQRDVISWNSMIGGFAHHGFAMEALHLFKEMKIAKIRPTQITFVSVLHACGHAGLVEDGKREFDSMVKEFELLPNVEHYSVLVDLIGRHGKLDEALEVIKDMVIPPDRAVWGALLGACRIHNKPGLADIAAEALAAIEPNGCASYVLRYNIHADEGRWQEALQVRESMDRKGVFKHPGYSWIELQNKVHVFIAGDCSHPLSEDIYSLIETCNRFIRDSHMD
ncbi:Pentatricopeptide repeat-containing protein [Dendrobium catenatum]|nr:Pentatricopeptide repeat-containing protein [Dendrobium catenatum]